MPTFVPRTNYNGITTLPAYNEWNYYTGSFWLPNCVAYSYGRMNEVNGQRGYWPIGDANQWFGQASRYGLQTGNVPQVGAVICWDSVPGQGSGAGHTANVEALITDSGGNVTAFRISNSLYSETDRTPKNEMPFFFMGTVNMSNLNRIDYDNGYYSIYVFQGFLYHPLYPPGVSPGPQPGILDTIKSLLITGNLGGASIGADAGLPTLRIRRRRSMNGRL